MGQILVKRESLDVLKGDLETLKEEFGVSITDINTNLDIVSSNWKGKKANDTLKEIEILNTTNTNLLTRIEKNIEYIQGVIDTIDKVNAVEVETKPEQTKTEEPVKTPEPIPTEPIQTPEPIETSKDNLTVLDTIPVIEKTPTPEIEPTQKPRENISFDQRLIKDLGLKTDKDGRMMRVGNAYIGNIDGMDYLVHIPSNGSGNVPSNLPVFIEFHGSGEAGKNRKISAMPTERMGLKQIETNPNFQAIIIMPQVKNPNYYASEYPDINAVQRKVISTLNANGNIIIPYGHSSGSTGGIKYVSNYPEGIKMFVSVDGRPSSTSIQTLRDENIPVLFVNSNKGNGTPYNKHANNLLRKYPEFQNLTYNIKDLGINDEVTESIEELIGTNDLKAIYISGSTHSTVRDAVINENFYSSILKKFESQNN